MTFEQFRKDYHKQIFDHLISLDENGVPNNADKHSKISVEVAKGIVERISLKTQSPKYAGQTTGSKFEHLSLQYLRSTFHNLLHIRPGHFEFYIGTSIENFEQYEHLATIAESLSTNRELRATLGDYIISPDIVIGKSPIEDKNVNKKRKLIKHGAKDSSLTPLRLLNNQKMILHASVSCKWTIRSDRSQNTRTEALNLIRNRKGNTPHIVVVTGEPHPQRIASLALGTGDIDCVYHFALKELRETVNTLDNEMVTDVLGTLIDGKRLRDISDLPFDLCI